MVSFSSKPIWNFCVQVICLYWFPVLLYPWKWDSDSGSDSNLWPDSDSRFESPKKRIFDKLTRVYSALQSGVAIYLKFAYKRSKLGPFASCIKIWIHSVGVNGPRWPQSKNSSNFPTCLKMFAYMVFCNRYTFIATLEIWCVWTLEHTYLNM